MPDRNEAIEQKVQAKLDQIEAQIEQWRAKAKEADADRRLKMEQETARLQQKADDLKNRMNQLQDAGEDAAKTIRTGLETAWSDLQSAMSSAKQKFE